MFISPMLLLHSPNNEPFEDPNCICELKLDGFRLVVSHMNGKLQLYTRHNNEITHHFEELLPALTAAVPAGTVLDGELIVADSQTGKPDFEALEKRFHSKRSLAAELPVTFCAFDILISRGVDVTGLALMRRKELLQETVATNEHVMVVPFIEWDFTAFHEICRVQELEGIVIKQKNSRYAKGKRSGAWQKVVHYLSADVVITGYCKKKVGWLISRRDGSRIVPAGVLELGLHDKARKSVFPLLHRSQIRETRDYVHVEPLVHLRVKFRNWTKNGMMRLPVLDDILI